MTTSINLDHLTTGYRHRRGVKTVSCDITASLSSGTLTCLLGPNGAGKSTLLRTLIGFTPVIAGSVSILGKEISLYTPSELSKAVSVVLTERVMLSDMSVEELVGMGRAPYTGFWGRLSDNDMNIVSTALAAVGAEAMSQRPISTLSDGERQKVMIAKALAQQTPVILLDEPTAFLDYPSKVEIMRLLQSLAHSEGKTIFLSTHDVELALRIADTLWLIDRKRGVATGSPGSLSQDGTIGAYFERPGIKYNPEHLTFDIT